MTSNRGEVFARLRRIDACSTHVNVVSSTLEKDSECLRKGPLGALKAVRLLNVPVSEQKKAPSSPAHRLPFSCYQLRESRIPAAK